MTSFLQLALALSIVILAAKLGGYLSYRLGQPTVLGELLVGIVLGPTVLNFLNFAYFSDDHLVDLIHELAEVGVLMLMFIAGLGLHISDLRKSGKVAVLAGSLGVIFPLVLGTGMGVLFSMDIEQSIFMGLILAATSVSISAQTLLELGVLRSRVGIGLLGAAVFDDILVVLGLAAFVALTFSEGKGLVDVLWIVVQMAIFLFVASLLGRWLLPKLVSKFYDLPISQGLMAFIFVVVLIYGWSAEELGHMAAITGAFLAGILLSGSSLRDRILSTVSVPAYGIFVPIFFVDVGLKANGRLITGETIWLLVVMTVVAVASKIIGSGGGARLAGFSQRESLQLGVGMMSRGEVGLIVATVGISEGLISEGVYASIIGVVILTTLMTPPMLRALFKEKTSRGDRESEVTEGEMA